MRILKPEPVGSVGMLVVAGAGLVINLISMRLLSAGKDKSLNIKGAYLEVWADMLGSLGVIGGAILIMLTGWTWVDPVVAIGIGLWVLPRTWTLLRETTHVLLEGVPRGLALNDVRTAVAATPGVASVHDLHVWSITSDETSCSVHVGLADGVEAEVVRAAVSEVLARFGLTHVTLQVEEKAAATDNGHL